MTIALLRFGLAGTLILAALPLGFALRYLLSRQLARFAVETRPLDSDERARLEAVFAEAGLPAGEVRVAPGIEGQRVGLSGTPRNRLVLLSESTVERSTATELTGLVGIAAGKHEVRLPELYTGYLVVASAAFAVLLAVDPSGVPRPLAAALVVGSLGVVGLGLRVLRRRVSTADQAAAQRVGHEPVRAAIEARQIRQLPKWVPERMHPKPSDEQRLSEL